MRSTRCWPQGRRWSRSSTSTTRPGSSSRSIDWRRASARPGRCCSPIARRARANWRCPTLILSPPAPTSSAVRQASACCWCGTSPRSTRWAGRRRAIAGDSGCAAARWRSQPRWRRGRTTWSAWPACGAARGWRQGDGRGHHRRGRAAHTDNRRGRFAGRVERVAAGPVRPRWHRGFRRQRLLVGEDEGSAVLAAMGVPRRNCRAASSASASGRRRATRTSSGSSPSGGGSPSARGARPHDLSRLSGDDAGCARSRARRCGRGSRRSSPTRIRRRAGARGGGGDRGGARAGRTGDRARRRQRRLHRQRDRGAQLGAQGDGREGAEPGATGSSPSRPSMPRCSTRANGWRGRGVDVTVLPVEPRRTARPRGARARARRARRAGRGDAGEQRDRCHPADRRDCSHSRTRRCVDAVRRGAGPSGACRCRRDPTWSRFRPTKSMVRRALALCGCARAPSRRR